jgi:hypothetical protein
MRSLGNAYTECVMNPNYRQVPEPLAQNAVGRILLVPFREPNTLSIVSERSCSELRQELLSVGSFSSSIQVFDFGHTLGIGQNIIPRSGLCLGPLMYCQCRAAAFGGSIVTTKWRLPSFMLASVFGLIAATLLLIISLATGLDAPFRMIGGPELSSDPVRDVALKIMLISIAINVLGRSLPHGQVLDYLREKLVTSQAG